MFLSLTAVWPASFRKTLYFSKNPVISRTFPKTFWKLIRILDRT
jgi:hypothetical protein